MRFVFFLFLMMTAAAHAADKAAILPKGETVPFRTDSALITTEYYLATGKYAEALETAANVLSRHPSNADAYNYRGYAYMKLGDIKKAAENFNKAIAIDPAHLGANRYLASLYLQTGNLTRAIEQLQVIRSVCGASNCEEQDELEAEINAVRTAKKSAP